MVMPEWFFIDPAADTLVTPIDNDALHLLRQHPGVRVLPILSNVNTTTHDGNFDGKLLSKTLRDPLKREKLLTSIEQQLKLNHLQGVNIDFEEVEERCIAPMHAFQRQLYERLHNDGLLVTQDISAGNEDFHLAQLDQYNDYFFLMAYDQHYPSSVPGPVCEQRWIEKQLDEIAAVVPSTKIILGLAAYGYDWPDGSEGATVTYQQALSEAKEFKRPVQFSNDSYNCYFDYGDNDSVHHTVSFTDAASTFNTMRFADDMQRAEAEMEATRLLIEATTGRSTILFRAPYNADAEPTKAVELRPVARGKQNSYYTVGESIDPEDWDTRHGVNADSIYNRVVRQYTKDPSRGIILLHDAGGDREATVKALPRIIGYFKNKGVRFTSVSHLLGINKDAIMPPVKDRLVK
ncbi:hypothetical protein OSTOST_12330, partial [Ostertagia ostertagi]